MTLLEKQFQFAPMIADLIRFTYENGYTLSFGDAYRDPRVPYGHRRSLHRHRLAIDFNLFLDKNYLRDTSDHIMLGEYWESIGGTWGGRFGDGNHYSLAHGGMK